jgi:hypothetical protein
VKAASRYPVESMVIEEPDLEELFFAYYQTQEVSRAA